jgi:hypothetical protein
VFEKAQRKVQECTFFVSQLRGTQDPDATEFFFNALLNAGKNVVYALHAQVLSYVNESMDGPRDEATKKAAEEKARQSFDAHIKAWKGKTGGIHATVFCVLQDARDIETHTVSSAVNYLPRLEHRQHPRSLQADPYSLAVVVSYLSRRQLSPEVSVPTTVYVLQFDPKVASDKSAQKRLKQFAQMKPWLAVELGATYTKLLVSLVGYFSAHYVPPTPV